MLIKTIKKLVKIKAIKLMTRLQYVTYGHLLINLKNGAQHRCSLPIAELQYFTLSLANSLSVMISIFSFLFSLFVRRGGAQRPLSPWRHRLLGTSLPPRLSTRFTVGRIFITKKRRQSYATERHLLVSFHFRKWSNFYRFLKVFFNFN